MPVMYNTGDWFSLRPGNTYRKLELYSLEWPIEIDLDYMKVYGSPFGGPMAIIRDFQKYVPVKGSAKPTIMIVDPSGKLISIIHWNHGNIVAMGWSDTEELLVVQDDGLVFIYNMFGEEKHTFSMGQEASVTKVIDARVFASSAGTGVAVMTTNFRIFLINNVKDPKNRQLPELPKSLVNPDTWEVATEGRTSYCLVAREKEIIRLVQGQTVCAIQTELIDRPFKNIIKMSISYNHRYMALYTNNGILWLGTTDMKTKFCQFETGRSERPIQIEWILDSENCNQSDAVVITYPSLLFVVNTNGDQNMFTCDPAIFLIPEMDGVRIITNSSHEMIQKVPKCVQNIFAINSQEPASFLFEAHKKFLEKSHQSDEYLELFRGKIEIAVSECIAAAGFEFDTETQKSLIKTAYFGKGFIPSHNPDTYIQMCRVLRVLNALRHPFVAMPLTNLQFFHLTPDVVLDRLVFRKHYAIAIQVAKHLKLPESRILEHWAFHKVIYDKNDKEVANKITEKFKNPSIQGISFCNIAEKAHSVGRDELAIKLLELEPRAALQVPLLLKLNKNEKALYSATKSGDTDLVSRVLLQLKETTQLAKFQMIIREFSMAHNIYKKYCQQYSKTALLELFNLEDDFQSQAEYCLREAKEKNNIEPALLEVSVFYTKAHRDIEADLCNETRKLIKFQKNLSERTHDNIDFNGLSINDTIKALLKMGDIKQAEKLKSEFKVPDKSYWWFRIQTLADQYRWDELEKFSKSKKSPIGYEPFVEVCLKKNKINEAQKYLNKCRDDRRVKWYIRAGLFDEAAATAFSQRDLNSLLTIQMNVSRTSNRSLQESIENYINLLSIKK